MTSLKITIEGEAELNKLLDSMSGPELKKVAQDAVSGAVKKILKPAVVAETPIGPGRFGYHLKRRVTAGKAKRNLPAGIVKYRSARDHWLLRGTKPHRIRFPDQKARNVPKSEGNIRHPGSKANPIIDRVEASHGDRAVDYVADFLKRHFGLD